MQLDYTIEEMLLQSPNLVVYRARGRNGFRYSIARFVFPKAVLMNLEGPKFEAALRELKKLHHGCLRPVIDGGLDEVDGMPWVARVWWDGELLEDRMASGLLNDDDIDRLQTHGRSLIDALGDRAGAISFRARDIILSIGEDGNPVEAFKIDVQRWFLDWAMGFPPGSGREAKSELAHLISEARDSEVVPDPDEEPTFEMEQPLPVIPPPPKSKLMFREPDHSLNLR